tara:strand:- start:360 stop:1532 length:1173 start_codon:yes stop_codon:yes gene_type:complete
MAKLLKLRGGTTSQHGSFTGADREVTVDTDKETLVVHNGSQAGGFPLARADGSGSSNFTITGELDCATLDVSGNADIDGTLEADAMTLNGTAITTTATLSTGISNTNVLQCNANVADNDFLRIDGTSVEGRTAAETLSDIGAAPAAGSSNVVTTGALNSGSITSGFGAIDNGSSAITTTGTLTAGTIAGGNTTLTSSTASEPILTLKNTNADATPPGITFQKDSSSPADNDEIGNFNFYGDDDGGNVANYCIMKVVATDVTNGTEDGQFLIRPMINGTVTTMLTVDTGVTSAGNVTAYSDVRLKSDIETIENGLEKVEQLRGVTYTRNDFEEQGQQVGVIAQEIEEVLPQVVKTASDEMETKSVDYGKITAVLIEAVKELSARVKELENK